MLICRACKLLLPCEKFKLRGGRQAGQRHTMCNRCLYVKYTRPRVLQKTSLIRQYKLDNGCDDCGYNTRAVALEFDHRPGEVKLFNIGEKIGSYSMAAIWIEVAKCDVVCANCHAIRTEDRRVLVA